MKQWGKLTIDSLTDRKNELHRENLHLKEMIDPIRKKAELLYPEFETAVAISKLARDIENVRSLATRDVYKPLASDQKKKLIEMLRTLRLQYAPFDLSVTIKLQQGSASRAKVANDLKLYLEEAGFITSFTVVMSFFTGGIPPDISIERHPEDIQLAQQLVDVVGTLFINKRFSGKLRDDISRRHLEIYINGDPLFTESGVVSFR